MLEVMSASMDGNCAIELSVIEMNTEFSLYPNPANDWVSISGWDTDAMITITDVSGRIVRQETLRNNRLETSTLTDGIYVVSLTDGSRSGSMRLIVQH
jgi:hypothetical protein